MNLDEIYQFILDNVDSPDLCKDILARTGWKHSEILMLVFQVRFTFGRAQKEGS